MSSKSTSDGCRNESWNKDGIKAGNERQEMDDISDTDGDEVELRPFRYMVGGHSYVLEVSRSAICKNYRHGEASFYKRLPEELRSFTPRYLGEIYVTLHVADDHKRFTAKIPINVANQCKLLDKQHHSDVNSARAGDTAITTTEVSNWSTKDNKNTRCEMRTHLEEWSNSCLYRHNRAAGTWENKQSKKFFMLENLLRDYDCPSIIDIKLGKHPRTDATLPDQNLSDRIDQRILFRIDGCKKFNFTNGNYTVLHKDITRHFSMKKVIEEIGNFFHDGRGVRVDAINRILERLDALRLVLGPQKEWTFTAASLLLMYDNSTGEGSCVTVNSVHGSFDNTIDDVKADVKLIDFLKTDVCEHFVDENDNAVKGISFEILKLKEILMEYLSKNNYM